MGNLLNFSDTGRERGVYGFWFVVYGGRDEAGFLSFTLLLTKRWILVFGFSDLNAQCSMRNFQCSGLRSDFAALREISPQRKEDGEIGRVIAIPLSRKGARERKDVSGMAKNFTM